MQDISIVAVALTCFILGIAFMLLVFALTHWFDDV